MIESLLPASAASAEIYGDVDGALFDEENLAIAGARTARRNEFVTGRTCARLALAQLGEPAGAIPVGLRGSPQWPVGVVGSISHCAGYRVAAVAHASSVLALGIDAEPNEPLPAGVIDSVATPFEHNQLTRLSDPVVHWDRLMFSAKESVYKAWFPIAKRWLGWQDVSVRFLARTGTFEAGINLALTPNEQLLRRLRGRWLAQNGLILTVVTVPLAPL